MALEDCSESPRGATLYVTLEPCCHQGKTPPCSETVVAAGIATVHVAVQDPDERVRGQGLERMRSAGLEVSTGLLEAEARELNRAYFKHRETGLPLVTLKLASSLDGRIATATGESKWITGPESRRLVHRLRAESMAVLVGSETVLSDDPTLDVRGIGEPFRQPLRVVVDSRLRTSAAARVLSGDHPGTVIAAGKGADAGKAERLSRAGAEVVLLDDDQGGLDLESLLRLLGGKGIISLLLEGGGRIAASFVARGLVDRVAWFVAPLLVGGGESVPSLGELGIGELSQAPRVSQIEVRRLASDILMEGKLQCSPD
jgi:diaminohydroxyphosphoribosylaminopyrimidine deaminase/5-amino-6-(5-phosphoribosylamino)uracil reductase